MVTYLTFKDVAEGLNIPLTGKWGGVYRWLRETKKDTVLEKLSREFGETYTDYDIIRIPWDHVDGRKILSLELTVKEG